MAVVPLPELTLFSRPGCGLCEEFLEALVPLCHRRARLVVRNLDDSPDWQARYALRIPVLCLDGREIMEGHLDPAALALLLRAPSPP
jgi:Glutaredoxin-like domain (DUF836)